MISPFWKLLLPLLVVAGKLAAQQHPGAEARVGGEYGLWVEESEDSLRVAWLTEAPDSGFLRVVAGEREHGEFRTPASTSHAVRFARPRSREVSLQYGTTGEASGRHQTTVQLGASPRPRTSHPVVDSLFVLGDVHGEFDRLVALLRNAGLVDGALRWTGGRHHLVFAGDVTDRGPDVTRTLWFLYRLEREAERAGGRVHLLLGNHEIMVLAGDLRYVHPRESQIAARHGVGYTRLFDHRRSTLGKWLASKPAVIRIGDALFAHGGVTPSYRRVSLDEHRDSLAAFMEEELFTKWFDTTYVVPMDSATFGRRQAFLWGDESVFWNRGYVQSDTLGEELASVLRAFRSRVLVVGHTPQPSISVRYGGALIAAHPATPAAEMLLLVRSGKRYHPYRLGPTGPPVPLCPQTGCGPRRTGTWSPDGPPARSGSPRGTHAPATPSIGSPPRHAAPLRPQGANERHSFLGLTGCCCCPTFVPAHQTSV